MNWLRNRGFGFLIFILPLVLLVSACTPTDAERLEGILQNVDTVNGKVTITTKDGKTVTLRISTEAAVQTEGATSAIETLEPGVNLEIEVDDTGQTVRHIEAHQAEVEGTIIGIEGDEVSLQTERGRTVTIHVTDSTRIRLEDDLPGTLGDLQVGMEVEIKYDPESTVAFKIHTEEEEAEIEGVIVEIAGQDVTVETERGRRLTLVVGDRTSIELEEDLLGTLADLQVGARVEVKFDPLDLAVFTVEVEDENEGEFEGGNREEDDRNREDDDFESEAAESIPHTLEGRDDCLACHQQS